MRSLNDYQIWFQQAFTSRNIDELYNAYIETVTYLEDLKMSVDGKMLTLYEGVMAFFADNNRIDLVEMVYNDAKTAFKITPFTNEIRDALIKFDEAKSVNANWQSQLAMPSLFANQNRPVLFINPYFNVITSALQVLKLLGKAPNASESSMNAFNRISAHLNAEEFRCIIDAAVDAKQSEFLIHVIDCVMNRSMSVVPELHHSLRNAFDMLAQLAITELKFIDPVKKIYKNLVTAAIADQKSHDLMTRLDLAIATKSSEVFKSESAFNTVSSQLTAIEFNRIINAASDERQFDFVNKIIASARNKSGLADEVLLYIAIQSAFDRAVQLAITKTESEKFIEYARRLYESLVAADFVDRKTYEQMKQFGSESMRHIEVTRDSFFTKSPPRAQEGTITSDYELNIPPSSADTETRTLITLL